MRAYERLLEYVKVKTPSSEESMETPSSSCQFELAERLVGEMKETPSSARRALSTARLAS